MEVGEFLDGLHVVGVMRIAALDAGERGVGQRGFDFEGCIGVGFGLVCALACETEQLLNVCDVLLANLHALRVRLGVVVAVGKAEAAGVQLDDHQRRVDRILARAGAEEKAAGVLVMKAGEGVENVGAGFEGVDLREDGIDGLVAQGVDGGGVHAGGEVVAYLLLYRCAVCRFRIVFEDSPEKLLVVIAELGVDAPSGLICGDGVIFLPAAATEFVEIDTRVSGAVEAGDVEGRRVGHGLQGLRRGLLGGEA